MPGILVFLLALSIPQTHGQANHIINWQAPATDTDRVIAVGDTVTWVWNDALLHSVTSTTALFDSGLLSGMGTTYQVVFTSIGTFGFLCAVHGATSMGGTITVNEPLPVEQTTFGAIVDGSDVILSWTTESETNNAGFLIQIAPVVGDADRWLDVDFVDGAGRSLSQLTYVHRISGLTPGVYRFRLKQIDFDGSTTLSDVVEAVIEIPGTHFVGAAYPNPVTSETRFTTHLEVAVAAPQVVDVAVYTVDGRFVEEIQKERLEANATTEWTINGSRWPSGSYVIRIRGERFDDSRLLTVVR